MEFVATYHALATTLADHIDAPHALIKVHAGMAIYLGCLLLMGTRRGSLAAVGLVVLLAMFHETMNRLQAGAWDWDQATRDLVLVLFWPTMCYAVSSLRRWAWSERARERANARLLHLYDYRPARAPENAAQALPGS